MQLRVVMTLACGTLNVLAPSITCAQPKVVIRELAPVDAKSTGLFGNIFGVRQLPGGKVLVNDGVRRQLVLLDATMANRTIVLDSIVGSSQSYGRRPSPLISYSGDSTLFVDGESVSFVVIDPLGKVARTMAPPNPKDMVWLSSGTSGTDELGNLLYRSQFPSAMPPMVNGARPRRVFPDTAPILRANLDTRRIDTIASLKISPMVPVDETRDAHGGLVMRMTLNPLIVLDEWATLSDGSVAIVRGHDYHVDIVLPNGRVLSAPKLPFDFRRLTDDDKQKLVDSARTAEEKRRAEMPLLVAGRVAGVAIARPAGPADQPTFFLDFVPFSQIPDYYPPIRSGAVKADDDGNLWILPTTSAQSATGELVYDVVSNRGALMYRVRVPSGRSITGFGKNGVVYLMSKNGDAGWVLERTKLATGEQPKDEL